MTTSWQGRPFSELEDATARQTIQEEHTAKRSRVEARQVGGETLFFADRSSFPALPTTSRCPHCRFREICPEGQAML